MSKGKVVNRFFCDDGSHAVVTVRNEDPSPRFHHRREPCEQCPWRADLPTGVFPASAFWKSADTAYDMALNTFACHMSGLEKPATCAGFLLRGADHNIGVRFAILHGRYDPGDVGDGGFPLYRSYRAMAVANGMAPDDERLAPCRGVDEDEQRR